MWDRLYEKKPDNTFFKIMANKKIRSAIYLLLWFIAIWILYIVFIKPVENYNNQSLNTTNGVDNVEFKEITYEEKKQALLGNNYSYIFKYNEQAIYKGDLLSNKSSGYLETDDGIIKYFIEEGKEYIVNFGGLSETTYDDKFNTFFSPNYIFNLTTGHYPIILDNVYSYQIDDNYIKIITDNSSIKKIEISWNSDNYTLEFSNIGQIKSIDY